MLCSPIAPDLYCFPWIALEVSPSTSHCCTSSPNPSGSTPAAPKLMQEHWQQPRHQTISDDVPDKKKCANFSRSDHDRHREGISKNSWSSWCSCCNCYSNSESSQSGALRLRLALALALALSCALRVTAGIWTVFCIQYQYKYQTALYWVLFSSVPGTLRPVTSTVRPWRLEWAWVNATCWILVRLWVDE